MEESGVINPHEVRIGLHANHKPTNEHQGRYNSPSTSNSEIAIIISGVEDEIGSRLVILNNRDDPTNPMQIRHGLIQLDETHRSYDPLQYPLLFPTGQDGWHIGIPHHGSGRRTVSTMEFYCYRLMQRSNTSYLHASGPLLQQYMVDQYAKVEQARINWVKRNQATIRSALYQGLVDAIAAGDGSRAG